MHFFDTNSFRGLINHILVCILFDGKNDDD